MNYINARKVSYVGAPGFLLILAGCEDPLKNAQSIEEPRVLGVRVATVDDQASIAGGEDALFEVLLADSEGTLDARVAYTLCEAADAARGVPVCEGEVLAEASAPLNAEPIAVALPDTLSSTASLALLGVACLRGEPRLPKDPLKWDCPGAEPPLRFSFDVRPSSTRFTNQNPDLSALQVAVGGVDVPLDDLRAAPSCAAEAPEVQRNEVHEVEIALGRGARETGNDVEGLGEALQVSHFSTEGMFERQYSFVAIEAAPRVTLEWEAPAGREAVKQYLVVRDGRGGVAWASWSFCAR